MTTHSISKEFQTTLRSGVTALLLATLSVAPGFAEDAHSHGQGAQHGAAVEEPQAAQNAATLLSVVRAATERFKDVAVAEAEGYSLQFGCVTGDESGAMGLHYVNTDLVNKGVLDATRPQIIIYEPLPNGGKKLIGADFLVIADMWNSRNPGPPQLMGQFFHLFNAPNRFGLPPFYTLHVWAWKENPNGAFVNWHPHVSCQPFAGQ